MDFSPIISILDWSKKGNGKKTSIQSGTQGSDSLGGYSRQQTINELSSKYEIHPNQITLWKRQLLESAKDIFSTAKSRKKRSEEYEMNNLYQDIGKLKVELDFLKKVWI